MQLPTLVDGSLRLEAQTQAHAPALFALLADPLLYPAAGVQPASEAALRERLALLESRRSPDALALWLNWVLVCEAELLGYVQATVFQAPDGRRTAWVAYVLGRAHWGRGWATRALRCLEPALQRDFGVQRFAATVDAGNARSLALLARCGYAEAAADDPLRQGLGPGECLRVKP